MPRNFRELEAKTRPESLARAKARAKETMAEMLESQDDMQISTLRRLIQALGGELEIIAHLPNGDIRLCQFKDVA